jgi:hypothetical protein
MMKLVNLLPSQHLPINSSSNLIYSSGFKLYDESVYTHLFPTHFYYLVDVYKKLSFSRPGCPFTASKNGSKTDLIGMAIYLKRIL